MRLEDSGSGDGILLSNRYQLIKSAVTSSSKVVSQYSNILAPFAVDSVSHIIDGKNDINVDLREIRIVTRLEVNLYPSA